MLFAERHSQDRLFLGKKGSILWESYFKMDSTPIPSPASRRANILYRGEGVRRNRPVEFMGVWKNGSSSPI